MSATNRIQILRKSRHMSQEELGEKMFVSRQTVSQWETGQTLPSIDSLIKLHEIFGVTVDEILGISVEENHPNAHDQSESYSFHFDAKEVERIGTYATKPLRKRLLLTSIFAILCLIIMGAAQTTSFTIPGGILFGIFFGYILMLLKTIYNVRQEWRNAARTVPNRVYSYAIANGALCIKITENGNLISEAHKPIEAIKSITDVDGYYWLVVAGRSYLIRKADLESDSNYAFT